MYSDLDCSSKSFDRSCGLMTLRVNSTLSTPPPADATHWPSGDQATQKTTPDWPGIVNISRPVSGSQTVGDVAKPPDTIIWRSLGRTARLQISFEWCL